MWRAGDAQNSIPPGQSMVTAGVARPSNPRLPRGGRENKINYKNRKYHQLDLLYYNCRGVSGEDRLQVLENETKKIKWDIIGLAEVRRLGEKLIQGKNRNFFYYFGETRGFRGVVFYINKKVMNHVIKIQGISERIGIMKLKVEGNIKILLVQIYAPTAGADEDEIKKFYKDLQKVLQKESIRYIIIMGDWNAKVGNEEGRCRNVGRYGLGKRNERGERLVEFTRTNNLKIANTFFKGREKTKWTWTSPDSKTKNEIDHVIVNDLRIIKNIKTLAKFEFPSFHRISRVEIKIPKRMRIKNFIEKQEQGRWIIPVKNLGKARRKLIEKLKGLGNTINWNES